MINKCKSCGFLDVYRKVCHYFNNKVDPYRDYCSHYQKEMFTCEICGNAMSSPILEESNKLICAECFSMMGTCNMCGNVSTCSFETSPINLPKMIQKVVEQGNMRTMTTVRNPERIEKTCKVDCKCYNDGCMRQEFQTCSEYFCVLGGIKRNE
jgi:hypothetical protein